MLSRKAAFQFHHPKIVSLCSNHWFGCNRILVPIAAKNYKRHNVSLNDFNRLKKKNDSTDSNSKCKQNPSFRSSDQVETIHELILHSVYDVVIAVPKCHTLSILSRYSLDWTARQQQQQGPPRPGNCFHQDQPASLQHSRGMCRHVHTWVLCCLQPRSRKTIFPTRLCFPMTNVLSPGVCECPPGYDRNNWLKLGQTNRMAPPGVMGKHGHLLFDGMASGSSSHCVFTVTHNSSERL